MFNLKNSSALAILSILISSCAVLPSYFGNTKTNQWMSQNKSLIGNKNLTQITIPGSYAGGSYAINEYSEVCRGELISNDNNAQIYNLLSTNESFTEQQITSFFITTKRPISAQLERGVRYFDLSLCLQDNQIFTSNMYVGETFNNVNQQILEFLNKHSNEIIIIDLDNHLWDENGAMSTSNINSLYHNIVSTYGNLIINKSKTHSFKINDLMKQNGSILITSNNPTLYNHNEIWRKDGLFTEISSKHWATIKKLTNLQNSLESMSSFANKNQFSITPIYSSYDTSTTSLDEINNKFNDELIADYLLTLPESAEFNIVVSDGRNIDAITKFATRNFSD